MSTTFIYALCDPRTYEVRYVGKADDPHHRYCNHLWDKSNTYKVHWIQSLLKCGLSPILQILEECQKNVWQQKEQDWIAFEKKIGCNLTNSTDGGEGTDGLVPWNKGKSWSKAIRNKISAATQGRDSPSFWKGKHLSKEHKAKVVKTLVHGAMRGKRHTKKTREQMSKAHSGAHNHFFGKHHSEAALQKMRNAKTRRIPSPSEN